MTYLMTPLMFLIAFQDLKQPYHLLNNEELKRLAAVESLMEVSAEENVSQTQFPRLLSVFL